MIAFLFFQAIYGLAHLYIFFKLTAFLKLGTPAAVVTGMFILFMAGSPVLIHIYTYRVSARTSRIFAYTGYMWIAFLILFSPLAIVFDLYDLIARNGIALSGRQFVPLSPSHAFLIPVFGAAVLSAYGYFEANGLRAEMLTVRTRKLPPGTERIKIAHISDLHLNIMTREATLDKIIARIQDTRADLIVCTGDLLDGGVKHIGHFAKKLKRLHAGLGKFAVIGNHEFFGGLEHSLRFIEDSGFALLRGRSVTIEGIINIAGVEDLEEMKNDVSGNRSHEQEMKMLSGLPKDVFTLLLKHRAEVSDTSLGLFDLQLSGHTHRGQIFPVSLITPFIFPYHSGFQKLSHGSALYVSRGLGTAGPPVRFLSPPEFTIIEVISENRNDKIIR
jgi:predicted MPP superfamily phosphohydrolase